MFCRPFVPASISCYVLLAMAVDLSTVDQDRGSPVLRLHSRLDARPAERRNSLRRVWLELPVSGGYGRVKEVGRGLIWKAPALIKKKIKFSSYIRKFRVEQLQSHIWLTASSYMGKYLRISHVLRCLSLYLPLQLLQSECPYIWGKFDFLFYQCALF